MESDNIDFCFLHPSERNVQHIVEKVNSLVNDSEKKPYTINFNDVEHHYSNMSNEPNIDEFSLNYTVYFSLFNNFTIIDDRLIRQAIFEEVRLFLYMLKKMEINIISSYVPPH